MALVGFPEDIDVTLGSAWTGRFGLSTSAVISLTHVGTTDTWSEDGTTVYNSSTNRLLVKFESQTGGLQRGRVIVQVGSQGTVTPVSFSQVVRYYATTTGGTIFDDYTFKQVFNGDGVGSMYSLQWSASSNYDLQTNVATYNSEIFSAVEDASAGGGGGSSSSSSASAAAEPTADPVATGQGAIEAASTAAHNADAVAAGRGTIAVTSTAAHNANAELAGRGTLLRPPNHALVDIAATGRATAEATASGAHVSFAESSPGSTTEATSTSGHVVDDATATGAGAAVAGAVKGAIVASAAGGRGSITVVATKNAVANPAISSQGAAQAASTLNKGTATKSTGRGTIEVSCTRGAVSSVVLSGSGTIAARSAACLGIEFHARGRHGVSVAQDQRGTDFPLAKPSTDVRYLLADAYMAYEDPADYDASLAPFALPFQIAWLYGFGCLASDLPAGANDPVHTQEVLITDQGDRVVFDSTQATYFNRQLFGERLEVFEWRIFDDAVCRLVRHTKWTNDLTPAALNYDLHLTPTDGTLDGRVAERMPKRVKSLTTLLSNFRKTPVELVNGFNVAMAVGATRTEPGRRLVTPVEISAVAGSGDGRFPGCLAADSLLRTINGQGGDVAGGFLLKATDCSWLRQPVTEVDSEPRTVTPTPATLKFGDSCQPCCPCDDFIDTAERMNEVAAQYRVMGDKAENTRDQFRLNIDRWNSDKACREAKPLSLVTVTGDCPFVDVSGQYCNRTDQCDGPILLNFLVEILEIDGDVSPSIPSSVDCRSASRKLSVPELEPASDGNSSVRYDMIGTHPNFGAYWPAVDPQDAVSVRFRLVVPTSSTPFGVRVTLTGCKGDANLDPNNNGVDFEPDGTPFCRGGPNINGEITRTVTLDCPDPC